LHANENPIDGKRCPVSSLGPETHFVREDAWISDLELMHHYTEVAYRTLSSSPSTYSALQHDVPRVALSSRPLLHEVLAFSAFHLAYLHPNLYYAYRCLATMHQASGISSLRESLSKPLTGANCHELYASSIFIAIGAFSTYPSFEKYNPTFHPIESLCDNFALINGMAIILKTHDNDLRSGPLNGLFTKGSADCSFDIAHHGLQALAGQLDKFIPALTEASRGLSKDEQRCVLDAATSLRDCVLGVQQKGVSACMAPLKAVFFWPIQISDSFLILLRKQCLVALLIVPFYCVLLSHAQKNVWFLEGWALTLLAAVETKLIDTAYTGLIKWPTAATHEMSEARLQGPNRRVHHYHQ
jgi:hypothetical protein